MSAEDGSRVDPHPGILVHHFGYTVLVTTIDGAVTPTSTCGLFDFDTRILSRYRWLLDDVPPELVSQASPSSDRWIGVLRRPLSGGRAAGPRLPQDALVLLLDRRVGPGLVEVVTVRNDTMAPVHATLRLELDADFADVSDPGRSRGPTGDIAREATDDPRELVFRLEASRGSRSVERAVRARVVRSDAAARVVKDGFAFDLTLEPGASSSLEIALDSLVDRVWRVPAEDGRRRDAEAATWNGARCRLEPAGSVIASAFERGAEDLFALRNRELERSLAASIGMDDHERWLVNAGVPTFTGFFGRDALTAGWQAAMVSPAAMDGALAWASRTQALEDDPWRDAEPGKMVHEMRRGPLSELDILPHSAYYGSQTTPAMFVLALSELWHWTGDDDVLRRHRDAALRTFEWAERYGDLDGDGFLEYRKRSPAGLKNQGWKDSDEAIRDVDGSLVDDPIATVEEQAFHLLALERMAQILVALGDDEEGQRFLDRARRLRTRWDEAFWMPEEGFYALALGPDKRQVRSIASNAGHALGTGAVPVDKARAVADRLMSPELFSGWGIRTLSASHPSFNPLAYHLGTVWPVENATFALGFKRYGLDHHLDRLAGAVFDAAARMQSSRLPEALAGYAREETVVPVLYPGSNSPQAWSASATVQLVQVLLGLYPFAPLHLLALVRPRLPEAVPVLTVRDLRVGDARISLRFTRESDGRAHHEILERDGDLHVLEAPPPQASPEDLGALEDVKLWALEHAPSRLARALRIGLALETQGRPT